MLRTGSSRLCPEKVSVTAGRSFRNANRERIIVVAPRIKLEGGQVPTAPGADDPLETVSGTQGLGGAADSVLVLKRDRNHRDATLFITGRDVEETEIKLRWDPAHTSWSLLGESLSEEREAVIRPLRHTGKPLSIKDITVGLGRSSSDSVRLLYWRMATAGQIAEVAKGLYTTIGYGETRDREVRRETVETMETVDT
jgi:hypothetical protein